MVINFKTRGISRDTRKLAQILTLIIIKKKQFSIESTLIFLKERTRRS